MAEWFETKVKFLRQMDNGLVKQITEQYLVDSMSFTEAEGRVMTEVGEGMREVAVVSIKRSAIKETVMYGDTDMFFKVKVAYTTMDETTEKEKKVNTYLLVNANDAKEAYERTEEHLKEMLVPFTITQISESPIIEVYQYQKGLRPGLRKVENSSGVTGVTITHRKANGEEKSVTLGPDFKAKLDAAMLRTFGNGVSDGGVSDRLDGFDGAEWLGKLVGHQRALLDAEFLKQDYQSIRDHLSAHFELGEDEITAVIAALCPEESQNPPVQREPEKEIDCAYPKSQQVGRKRKHPLRSQDDAQPELESPFHRDGFQKSPKPDDLSANGLDFAESLVHLHPKTNPIDPTEGQAVDFEIDPIPIWLWEGFVKILGDDSITGAQAQEIYVQSEFPMGEFRRYMGRVHGANESQCERLMNECTRFREE